MPPLALASLLHRTLPWLSGQGRAVINWLVCYNGRVGSTHALVQRLGLPNRFCLSRLLRAEGLPPYEELSGWVCVLYWMLRADNTGATLRMLAREAGMSDAGSYRLVRRVTGQRWSVLRRTGTAHVARLLVARCARPPAHASSGRLARPGSSANAAAPSISPPRPDGPRPPVRLALPGAPGDVAVHPAGWAYVTCVHAALLERLDLTTLTLAGSVPVGCAPSCIAFDHGGGRAYVSAQYDDAIAVVDTARHRLIGTLRVPADPYPVLLSASGRTLYVTTNEDRLYALALPHGRTIATLSLPATSHHLALHPSGQRLYVATRTAGSVLEVDTARHRQLRSFAVGGWTQGLTVSADGRTLFVANEKDGVNVIHLASGQLLTTIRLDGGPCELALSPDQRQLYVGLVHAGKVAILDCGRMTVSAVLEVGGQPRGIVFDRSRHVVTIANHAGWLDILPAAGTGDIRALAVAATA